MSVPERKQDLYLIDQQSLVDLDNLADRLDQAQLWWASGYLAGRAGNASASVVKGIQPETAGQNRPGNWTILFGTETGNARTVSERFSERAASAGIIVDCHDLRDYKPSALKKEQNLLLIIATHGLGEPPDGTEAFFDYLTSDRAPGLEGLNYAVLALGDSSYEDFCATGQFLDERLAELGANRLHERIDCDVDFEQEAQAWIETMISKARISAADQFPQITTVPRLHAVTERRVSRQHPFSAPVLVNQKITGRDSGKDVRHIELSLENAGMDYLPGDALGVMPRNPPQLVEQFVRRLDVAADMPVMVDGHELPLNEALRERLEITRLSRGFLRAYADTTGDRRVKELLANENKSSLQRYFDAYQPIDVLNEYRGNLSAQELVTALRKLTPRLYSISSSPDANPDEAHLTVAVVNYVAFDKLHWGSASSYLAGDTSGIPVHVQPNPHFRLPQDPEANVIMIGAGTGIAPYRAFVEHRRYHGARGHNWLIFGDRTFTSDFLYQLEWQRHLKRGSLQRLDLAFSRDQARKIYVQHRIRECGRELYDWLEKGAHLYVCGDALHMAPGVHQALTDIVTKHRGVNANGAEDYLRKLKHNNRYQRDVY